MCTRCPPKSPFHSDYEGQIDWPRLELYSERAERMARLLQEQPERSKKFDGRRLNAASAQVQD